MKRSFCLTWFFLTLAAYGQTYTYLALPSPNLNTQLRPNYIDNNGNIVGNADAADYSGPAFRYTNGKTTFLTVAYGDRFANAYQINASGVIIGDGKAAHGYYHAMYATLTEGWTDIEVGEPVVTKTAGINDNNYIVGNGAPGPFLGDLTGWKVSLGAKLGEDFDPVGINNLFYIAGNTTNGGVIYNAWYGTSFDLRSVFGTGAFIGAINQNTAVAGRIGPRGFIYENGAITYFGNDIVQVHGMNIQGDVVGSLNSNHAFVYLRTKRQLVDLHLLINSDPTVWISSFAAGINDQGEICGYRVRPAAAHENVSRGYVVEAFKLAPGLTAIAVGNLHATDLTKP